MKEQEKSVQPWGTLEELWLACAVNRHGTSRWDSIAVELRIRSSISDISPDNCRRRFDLLRRRFSLSGDDDESAALVKRLTKIRLDDLRRDLRRSDDSIVSLELKVKSLEEERERSLKDDDDEKATSFENRRGSKSNDSNRSFDESNSTTQRRDGGDLKRKRSAATKKNTDRDREREREEENVDDAKQSSEVQSSTKRLRRGGDGDEAEEVSPPMAVEKKASPAMKSEPLISKLLGMVRSHRLASVFQRRLRSQESQRYKNMVRQHLDLQTIEGRAEKGVYSDHTDKFYRDLLLLFTNGIVFFRKGSQEHIAAKELRSMVLKEMKTNLKKVGKTKALTVIAKPELKKEVEGINVVLPKTKNKSPIMITCGKRNSGSKDAKKVNSNSSGDHKKGRAVVAEEDKKPIKKVIRSGFAAGEDKGVAKKKSQEIVGRKGSKNHSSNNNNIGSNSNNNNKSNYNNSGSSSNNSEELNERGFGGNELSSHDTAVVKEKALKKEIANSKKKKQGVASFLKRMKQNSPQKEEESQRKKKAEASDKEEEEEIDVEEEVEEDDEEEVEEDEEIEEENIADEEEEDRGKEVVEEKKKKGKKVTSKASDSPSKDQRVTRNSTKSSRAAKEERDRKSRRGVGRPPKKPEKEGKRGAGKETNGDHQPRKRSRR